MSFLQPVFLAGLLAAAIPIIIHLIHRRRPRKQPFPAIELVISSVRRVERRWRLRRILLLATRVLLIATLALAAARPLWGPDASRATVRQGPQRLAIVVDSSLSMRARYGNSTAFARGLTEARNRIDRMGPEDMAVIVAVATPPRLVVERPTGDLGTLFRALDELEPTYLPGDVGEAVTIAVQALGPKEAKEPDPAEEAPFSARVIVLSDLAQSSLQTPADLSVPGTTVLAALEVVDVVADIEPEERRNRSVAAIESVRVPDRAPRTVEIRTRIQSFEGQSAGGAAAPVDITLIEQDQPLNQGSVDVLAGTIVDKVFRHSFEKAGSHPVVVAIESDALVADDRRYAKVEVRQQVRTLVVDGAPSGVPKEDEVFYLERALLAGAADHPPPQIIGADDLARADLSAFDVVILAGVDVFNRQDGGRLLQFVERGGGLLVTASSSLDADLYNAELGRALPRPLRGLKMTSDADQPGAGAMGFSPPVPNDPITQPFMGEALGGLLSTRSKAYWLLEPLTEPAVDVHLRFEDGSPALISRAFGTGRLAVLTTSIDRDLSDLPIRPAFVPLMRRLVLYLGRALETPDTRRTLVGQKRTLRVPEGARRLQVRAPDGRETTWSQADLEAGTVTFEESRQPGHYRVRAAFAGSWEDVPNEHFAVNIDPRESDLKPLSIGEAQAMLLGQANGSNTSAPLTTAGLGQTLDPEILAALLLAVMGLAFIVESALSAWR